MSENAFNLLTYLLDKIDKKRNNLNKLDESSEQVDAHYQGIILMEAQKPVKLLIFLIIHTSHS